MKRKYLIVLIIGWFLALAGMIWSIEELILRLVISDEFNWWSILVLIIGYTLLLHAIVKESKKE